MSSRVRRLAATLALVVGAGALSSIAPVGAAPDDRTFAPLRGFEPTGPRVRVEPREYAATRVDLAALRAELPRAGTAVVRVPAPDGSLQAFRVTPTQVMEPELAAAHPEIATWAGRGVGDPRVAIALDITPMGFHAFVREPGARSDWYVDPAFNGRGTTAHLSYRSSALPAPEQRRAEGEISALRGAARARQSAERVAGQPVRHRYYRLALVSDPTYAAYFGAGNVLAEKATLVNRVNQIYNADLAVELRLVNGTDALNLATEADATGANGPCGAAPCYRLDPDGPGANIPGDLDRCSTRTLGRTRAVLGQLIGASNYDVGHLALGKNGGGVAYLGVVGGDYKAGGCTGLPQPEGDFFAIDYVAHEIGHQFGGNHTFNGALGSCGGNISEASVEPGSGSSVMAYAGICGQDDLQPHTDPYFSFLTVDEAYATMDQTPYANVEVQTVSLRGFDAAGESIVIGYGGSTRTLTRGSTYTAAGVEGAVEQLTGRNVSIAQWGFDEVVDPVGGPSDAGFEVIFNETPTVSTADGTDTDLPSLTVTSGSAGVSGFVGETAQGGPSRAQGFPLVSANSSPTVAAPGDRTLPVRTPFSLTGSATDADGDPVVYLWEQTNPGEGTQLADNRKAYGPLFRVFGDDAVVTDEAALTSPAPGINIADGDPRRVFPDMAQVLAGNTNAASGVCPTPTTPTNQQLPDSLLDCYSEFLPTGDYLGSFDSGNDRVMSFRLTARDQSPSGGGLAFDDVALRVDPSAGPFLVTSQATPGTTLAGGSAVPVTWAVNNTQALAANVRITLSTDGGATFGTVLAAGTPNDGTETVVMPNVDASAVRIRIEAVDNYFFDVNDAAFALRATPGTTPPTTPPTTPLAGVPDTTITSGPAEGSVVLERRQKLTYASTVTPATFRCTVDEEMLPCDASGVTSRFGAGTHIFSVAAVNAAGVADPTPATVSFTVPRDESTFARKGSWNRTKDKRAMFGDYLVSTRKGSELVTRVPSTDRIVLVFARAKDGGTARVFLGERKLGIVEFSGKRSFSRLKTFDLGRARKGKLRIVVATNKPVRIEGVAVVTTP